MRSVDSNKIQSIVINAKKEGKDIDLSHLMEITDDMPLQDVVWYYNNISGKRYEIERVYFDKYKIYQEWYAIYKLSDKKDVSFNLSLNNIRKYINNVDDLLEIYDVDFSDEVLRKLAFDMILETTPPEFDKWLHIYDATIFDKRLNQIALKHCLKFAKSRSDWQHIYSRSAIGSPIQLKAIENLYGHVLLSEEEKHEKEAKERESAAYKTQKEYNEMYENENFGSMKQGNIIVNKYIAADQEIAAGESGSKEEVTDNP